MTKAVISPPKRTLTKSDIVKEFRERARAYHSVSTFAALWDQAADFIEENLEE